MAGVITNSGTITDVSLSGGGPKGPGHIGILRALADFGLLAGIRRVNGTSVGSLIGVLCAVGMSPQAITDLIEKEDFKKLLDDDPKIFNNSGRPIVRMLSKAIYDQLFNTEKKIKERAAGRLTEKETEGLHLLEQILEQNRHRVSDAPLKFTFQDLNQLQEAFPDNFKLFSTNAVFADSDSNDDLKTQVFNEANKDTLNVNLVEACRASASLPLVLKPYVIGKTAYQDGGVLQNTLYSDGTPSAQQLMLVFKDPNSEALLDAWERYRKDKSDINQQAYEQTHLEYGWKKSIRNKAIARAFPNTQFTESAVEIRERDLRELLRKHPESVLIVNTPKITSSDFKKAKNKQEFVILYNYFIGAKALIDTNRGTIPVVTGTMAFQARIKLGLFLLEHFREAGGDKGNDFNSKQKALLKICERLTDLTANVDTVLSEYKRECAKHRHALHLSEWTTSTTLLNSMLRDFQNGNAVVSTNSARDPNIP